MIINFRRKNCESENVSNVIGPVICIGDFDDDYNMPPPKLPAPKVNPEYNYLKSVSIFISIYFYLNIVIPKTYITVFNLNIVRWSRTAIK